MGTIRQRRGCINGMMNEKKRYRLAAAVLIGGHSTRMGRPKESVVIEGDGRTFLDRICDEVDACADRLLCARYLSLRREQNAQRDGYIPVEDEYDDAGPMGGIISVLTAARRDGCDAVLVLACDLIRYDRNEMTKICERYRGEDILMTRTDRQDLQPLASIYSAAMTDVLRSHIEMKDLRIRNVLCDPLNTGWYDADNALAYENCNSLNGEVRKERQYK